MRIKPVITAQDREHFRVIAETEAELNLESIHACARREPGRNVEIGLDLSEFAASFGGDLSRPDPVPMIALWKARECQNGKRGG